MAQPDEDEFEEQLRQEELARLAKEDGVKLNKGASYVDDDGTVMEWDHERKAYFPKIDADFIAQYQINYGVGLETSEELTEEQKKIQYDEYWKNYYNVYSKKQPKPPKFDEEGNPVEDEESEENKEGENSSAKMSDQSKAGENPGASQQAYDPTSEEHYQYNLYYYGQEYADAYREYYQEHPDAELLPDWMNQKAEDGQQKKEKEKKKKKDNSNKGEKRKEPPREEGWFETDPESSTQVYVSGLPLDITDEEFNEIMSKCGLIIFDPVTRKPKLRLYKDADGKMKGDGLCTYIKSESVQLALQIVDGTELRDHTISVERATFEMKGDFDPNKKKKKLNNKQKNRLKERQQKLFDWRPDKNPFERAKHEKIVILKNMFDIKEFDTNPALINEIRADVREECTKFGDVRKVTLYDHNPEGVIAVNFKDADEADACIAALNGRWFAKSQVVALTHDGKTNYDVQETDEEKQKRLSKWNEFLAGAEMEKAKQEKDKEKIEVTASSSTTDGPAGGAGKKEIEETAGSSTIDEAGGGEGKKEIEETAGSSTIDEAGGGEGKEEIEMTVDSSTIDEAGGGEGKEEEEQEQSVEV